MARMSNYIPQKNPLSTKDAPGDPFYNRSWPLPCSICFMKCKSATATVVSVFSRNISVSVQEDNVWINDYIPGFLWYEITPTCPKFPMGNSIYIIIIITAIRLQGASYTNRELSLAILTYFREHAVIIAYCSIQFLTHQPTDKNIIHHL